MTKAADRKSLLAAVRAARAERKAAAEAFIEGIGGPVEDYLCRTYCRAVRAHERAAARAGVQAR